jgi:carbonic anhydrase
MQETKISAEEPISSTLFSDIRGGLVVFLVALPLCLGIALASGAPLFSGIIAGIVGGIVVGALSGSSLSVSGPAAGLTIIVLNAIEKLGQYDIFLLAVAIAGILQIGLGYARAGIISNYFPTSVIKGMLAAIGLTLILKQIPHALGYDPDAEGEFEFIQADGENTFTEIFRAFEFYNPGAVVISLVSIAILLLWERPALKKLGFFKNVPSALVVTLLGIFINYLYQTLAPALVLSGNHLVSLNIAKDWRELAASFSFPDFSQIGNAQVYVVAITLAVIASLETLLNVEATDKLDPLRRYTPPNRELKAQGVGNLISGLIGGMPITSVIVRSSVNINAGSRTKMAAIFHGILLLVSVAFLSRYLNLIPLAALAAILLVTGYKLANITVFKNTYALGWNQFIPFVVTTLAILFTDLLIGIGIGLLVGIFFILRANYEKSLTLQKTVEIEKEHYRIYLGENVSFLNKTGLLEILEQIPENSTLDIDGSKSSYIDHDVLDLISNFQTTARTKNIQVNFIEPGIAPAETKPDLPVVAPSPNGIDKLAYERIFENNRHWVQEKLGLDPNYFEDMARGQSPKFLFIGCSDSRMPVSEITGTVPGEIFVHRNVANLVVNTDLNLLSVLQYAVEVLKVEHVVVCGHYGCGGVKAAMTNQSLGLINKWLRNIKDVYRLHRAELNSLTSEDERFKRLVELNVIEQVYNLHKTSIIQRAWDGHANLHVHGWVYDLRQGLIKDLNIEIEKAFEEYEQIYKLNADTETPQPVSSTAALANPVISSTSEL